MTRDRAHDGVFDTARSRPMFSAGSAERAAGRRMSELISDLVWPPIGAFHDAEITADPWACAVHDGGMSATLRDLNPVRARFSTTAGWERQVIPPGWSDAAYPPADVRATFAASPNEPYLPGGWYRASSGSSRGLGPILLCPGIHGRMIFIEFATGWWAKLSQPDARRTRTSWSRRSMPSVRSDGHSCADECGASVPRAGRGDDDQARVAPRPAFSWRVNDLLQIVQQVAASRARGCGCARHIRESGRVVPMGRPGSQIDRRDAGSDRSATAGCSWASRLGGDE